MRGLCTWIFITTLLAGCTGLKVSKGDKEGVPYYLTKAEFVLTVDPPSATSPVAVYTVKEIYRPDFKEQYSVRPDSAWLAKTKFKLQFGDQGELVSTTSQLTEQVSPVIKSIGDFTVAAIGAVAKAAVLSKPTVAGDLLAVLSNTTQPATEEGTPYLPDDNAKTAKTDLMAKLRTLTLRYKDAVADRLVVSPEWRPWLRGVLVRLDAILEKNLSDATTPNKTKYTSEATTYKTICLECWNTLEREHQFSDGLNEPDDHRFLWIMENKGSSDEAGKNLERLVTAANGYRQLRLKLKAVEALVEDLLEPKEKFRYRAMASLEEEIRDLQDKIFRGVNLMGTEPSDLARLRAKWAQIVEVEREVARENALQSLLAALATRAQTPVTNPNMQEPWQLMKEYQQAREELEKVRTLIQAKRDTLRPPSPSNAQLIKQELYPIVKSSGEVTASDMDALTRSMAKNGRDLPEWLIVVEKGVNK